MDFYQPDNLEAIYGVGNPEAYTQGRQQVGMSNMFQDQQLQQQQAATQKAGLANLYDQQANPERLRKLQLDNEQTGYENMTKGVAGRQAIATEGLQLDAKKRQLALSMSEDELKSKTIQAQQDAYSLDPEVAARGKRMLQLSAAAIEARQKHADDMEKERFQRASAEKIAGGNNGTQLRIAQMSQDGQDRRAALKAQKTNTAKDVLEQVKSGKIGYEKASTIFETMAQYEDDPVQQAKYADMAARFEQANLNQRNATANGKVDIQGATGMPTQQVAPALGKPKQAPALPPGWSQTN